MKGNYYCFFPVRDGQDSINQVMDSLVNQTLQPKEIIVVEDGSTDNTSKILSNYEKEYPEMVRIIHTGSKTRDYRRIPKLWNMCLKKDYDYHMIGAGDCIFEREYAEKILTKFEENPNLVLCSGDFGTRKSTFPHGSGRFVKQSYFFKHYDRYPEIIGYESEIIFRAKI
jgi:glycosyltransferase involved in cell wall biosynthesis